MENTALSLVSAVLRGLTDTGCLHGAVRLRNDVIRGLRPLSVLATCMQFAWRFVCESARVRLRVTSTNCLPVMHVMTHGCGCKAPHVAHFGSNPLRFVIPFFLRATIDNNYRVRVCHHAISSMQPPKMACPRRFIHAAGPCSSTS